MQVKLLRFLQFGEIQRVGSDRVEKLDVRVIAATHRDLRKAIAAGSFREDLFFRLRVLDFTLPPLRERKGDLPLLIDHFLERFWKRPGGRPRLSAGLLARLEQHAFPGNVRELAHLIEQALPAGRRRSGRRAGPRAAAARAAARPRARRRRRPAPGPPPPPCAPAELTAAGLEAARAASAERTERAFLEALLALHQDNVSKAARESGIHRSYLQKLLARHHLSPSRQE